MLNGRYALVVGNEAILDTKIEPTRDVHQYFLRKVNEVSNVQYDEYYEIALDKNERINPVRRLIEDRKIQFRVEDVSKSLMSLLGTRLFTTVLTTTTDGYLECAMRQVWGNELRVVNIYDKDTVDEFQKTLKACRRGKIFNQPTLIYVFGKLDIDDLAKRYVKTEADAILLIEKWMRMDVESNNGMLDFIRNKRLLALGCKYDNWYFRFFWYVLTGINRSNEENDYDGMGEVAFSLDTEDKTDGKLLQFLDRTDICLLGDATAFITTFTKSLTEESENAPFRQQIVENRRRGSIFISYCSKDALIACQLFFRLREKKYDVWIDSARLYGGDDYENEIADAISESKIVITLLSPHVGKDLKNGDFNHYYNEEWKKAQQLKNKIIIPLAINGYSLRADYHQSYENIIKEHSSGIDLMESDGYNKLITSINEHINNDRFSQM